MKRIVLAWIVGLVVVSILSLLLPRGRASDWAQPTALDKYVATPDSHYGYELVKTAQEKGCTVFFIEMTSQAWLTTNEVDRPVWTHHLILVRPDRLERHEALLFIAGGSNRHPMPSSADEKLVRIAVASRSIVAELGMVPNQPLVFAGDGQPRSEDGIIAYTWDKFLKTGDPKWLARLPMTKSAVRAMDTVTDFCQSAVGGGIAVNRFVVAGGSKRGWTTWTTAAVDHRVIGIVPIVIDMLNVVPSFKHHWEAYGNYSPAVHDYVEMGIMDQQDTSAYRALLHIVEPYEYRERLTMPKFLINAAGDQYFLPDSWQFYWKDLQGAKYIRYVPNADHSLKGTDAVASLLAFYDALIWNRPPPRFSWKLLDDGTLRVETHDTAAQVKLWQATNPDARDFRLATLGPAWTERVLKPSSAGVYEAKPPRPERGWTAFMIELTYKNTGGPAPLKFTTGVHVEPDVTPYDFETKQARKE